MKLTQFFEKYSDRANRKNFAKHFGIVLAVSVFLTIFSFEKLVRGIMTRVSKIVFVEVEGRLPKWSFEGL